MPKGINVIPITWDTNEVDEYFKIIKTYIILLLEQRQKSDKDFKYSDSNNHNTIILEANNKKVNMNFDNGVFNSDTLIKTINITLRLYNLRKPDVITQDIINDISLKNLNTILPFVL